MPGWKTWTALEEVTAANMNSFVRDQTVQVFTNSSARSAAITAPTRGLVSLLTDSGALEIYYGATTGWARPWNQPWGIQTAPAIITVSQTFSTTGAVDMTGSTQTFNYTANRRYRLTYSGAYDSPVGAPTIGLLRVTDGFTVWGQANTSLASAADQTTVNLTTYVNYASSGSVSFKVQGYVAVGGDQFRMLASATTPHVFSVEDVGPTTSTAPAS
jgi:hypothetical protein